MTDETFLNTTTNVGTKSVGTTTNPISYGPVVEALVGEGKKFKTLDDLAKGKAEADEYIEQLKRENAELRDDVGKAMTMSEILDNLKKEAKAKQTTTSVLSEEDLAKLVESKLSEHEKTRVEKSNKQKVDEALIKRFGDEAKVEEHIRTKSQELGMTPVELKAMANSSPAAFLRLVDVDTNASTENKSVPSGTQMNSEALLNQKPAGIIPGTYKYYAEIRKNDPKKYYTPAVQNEMFENSRKLGEAFYK